MNQSSIGDRGLFNGSDALSQLFRSMLLPDTFPTAESPTCNRKGLCAGHFVFGVGGRVVGLVPGFVVVGCCVVVVVVVEVVGRQTCSVGSGH